MKLQLTGLLTLLLLLAAPASLNAQDNETTLRGPKNATDQYSGNVYGPINDSDTLWRIASRYRQNPNLSVYQVMVAIYELNPTAFEEKNLNLLVDGAILKLPSERYAARIDAEKAKQRALHDEQVFSELSKGPGASLENIKPSAPLVNQQDLFSTRSAIEDKITALDSQQAAQFDELRRQFAASLQNVQTILDENRKLYARVEQVNEDLTSLRTQVESDVQSQMDEQTALQRQLLDLMLKEEAERDAEKQNSLTNTLSQPFMLILGSGLITLLVVGGLITWLLSRGRKAQDENPVAAVSTASEAAPVADIAASASPNLEDTPELVDDELFNDDELLDDVLSNELEEALDDELESFTDLDDDMLVPDDEFAFDDGESQLNQDELDSLFDGEPLPDDSTDLEGIDLSEVEVPDELTTESLEAEPDPIDAADDDDIDALLAENQPADPVEEENEDDVLSRFESSEEEEKPEIDIDELLEEEPSEVVAALEEEDIVSDEMLDKIDREINDQNQAIDRLADTIVSEMEQLDQMADMLGDLDDEEEEIVTETSPSPQAIQDLEALSEELDEIDIEDMENADEFNEPLSDELIADLQNDGEYNEVKVDENIGSDAVEDVTDADTAADAPTASDDVEDAEADLDDPLTDELLIELESDLANNANPGDIDQDDLADELLAEFGIQDDKSQDDSPSEDIDNTLDSDLIIDETDALSEDLLAELETEWIDNGDNEGDVPSLLMEDEASLEDTLPPTEEEVEPATQADDADPLSDALEEFDRQLIEDIPSIADTAIDTPLGLDSETPVQDSAEEDIEDFNLEQEVDGIETPAKANDTFDELEDVPGLDDWLTEGNNEDHALLDDLEQADFDELLGEFDATEDVDKAASEQQKTETEALSLGNPDLDLNALLTDPDDASSASTDDTEVAEGQETAQDIREEDDVDDGFLDVETLMDSDMDPPSTADEQPLDLDVSLSDFTGVTDDEDIIDIDKDAGQAANLDLARVYIEMDDIPAAKELLNEVVSQGSDEQKDEAESLLAQLA
ncbi:FimV/HubP family polar landmark protein [Alteromonas sp. 14N.309.X.WAT.G.H12]|uniref:FimV/HubP family polar landmark protein n=1 Tax=Alteromonas sp. 14N.309.X.WAT.G.H12 TaxID=3120824 RepID=UPI002FD361B0